jgi:potassium/hydrogen antiporter
MSLLAWCSVTDDALLILVAGGPLAMGVVASLVAARLRLPALVLFLGLGMLIGTDGLGESTSRAMS